MPYSFLFYDLETSGVNPRGARIMQFAGQRTDMDLEPIGEPFNILIKLAEDILPEPDAILVTGITPQKTLAEGVTETEFVDIFDKQINKPGTIFTGFNSVRFDDEFMRFLFWRNLHDPYQWQWKDKNGRWDILDVSRMTRALRPEGIKWPFDSEGKPTNRLEYLSSVNKLDHTEAHDALSDVKATIALAKLIKQKQPKLFSYLINFRHKKTIQEFVESNDTFIYTSGKYPAKFEKTATVSPVGPNSSGNGSYVYDLRHDPSEFINLRPEELAKLWRYDKEKKTTPLPIKSLQYNRCPAIAPLSVLDKASQNRLSIDLKNISMNQKKLKDAKSFHDNLLKAAEILNKDRLQTDIIVSDLDVDSRLYDNFVADKDRLTLEKIRSSGPDDINNFASKLSDARLKTMLPLYKARNYPDSLNSEERTSWEDYRKRALTSGGENSSIAKF
ncbi:MAG TPA: exodeoxyribonuclease I, partial [Candidatus Saccharimonadales bacterium]|nr:exodeoxyribonuclease I [Candidatus Saccharimonadales bacterium]